MVEIITIIYPYEKRIVPNILNYESDVVHCILK